MCQQMGANFRVSYRDLQPRNTSLLQFSLVSELTVCNIIMELPSKSCTLNLVSVSLLHQCVKDLVPYIHNSSY
ncbi:hypothetical protein E2C01_057670 [Portunus trituberculatus]|uniref:Uncharacterized protein n=1 Tax=Portunus trituberculatus TaxID=210409 RepID=A0A5B7GTK8_PORTR|nr:hypothetical protein [Portunus trituberculatus]